MGFEGADRGLNELGQNLTKYVPILHQQIPAMTKNNKKLQP